MFELRLHCVRANEQNTFAANYIRKQVSYGRTDSAYRNGYGQDDAKISTIGANASGIAGKTFDIMRRIKLVRCFGIVSRTVFRKEG